MEQSAYAGELGSLLSVFGEDGAMTPKENAEWMLTTWHGNIENAIFAANTYAVDAKYEYHDPKREVYWRKVVSELQKLKKSKRNPTTTTRLNLVIRDNGKDPTTPGWYSTWRKYSILTEDGNMIAETNSLAEAKQYVKEHPYWLKSTYSNPLTEEEIERVCKTGKVSGFHHEKGIEGRPVYRYFVGHFTPQEAGVVLDFGATQQLFFTQLLYAKGYDVLPYEICLPWTHENLKLFYYDVVIASNVINTQPRTELIPEVIQDMANAVKPGGFLICNYPTSPRLAEPRVPSFDEIVRYLQEEFPEQNVSVETDSKGAQIIVCRQPKRNPPEEEYEEEFVPAPEDEWVIE
jgi:SAM-dependent methyltransferase